MSKYTATIIARQQNGEVPIPATVYGSWAAHRGLGESSRDWILTHVPSGRCIPATQTCMLNKAQAIEAARRIDAKLGGARATLTNWPHIARIIKAVMTPRRKTLGELQHDADVAEGCP